MGKIIDNDLFIQTLTQMYAGTKKWGTVRVIIKRSKKFSFIHTKNSVWGETQVQIDLEKGITKRRYWGI